MNIFQGLDVKFADPPDDESAQGVNHRPKSIFDGLDVILADAPEGQHVSPDEASLGEASPGEDTWGKLAARTGKSAIAGAGGGVIDAATGVYNIPAALSNATRGLRKDNPWEIDPFSGMPAPKGFEEEAELPLIPSAMDAIDRGVDEATGGYTLTPEQASLENEKWFQEGVKFAASVASGGGLASFAGKAGHKGTHAALKTVGSTKPSTIAGAGASGAAIQKASESDLSIPGSIGAGLGAGLAAEALVSLANPKNPRNIVERAKKGAATVTGFGRSNLNVPAIESAKNLTIDLPGVAATKGIAPAFAHQTMGKFPYFGDKLKEKIKTASDQYQKAWDNMLDSVGSPKTEEVSKNIDRSYGLMRSAIPENATVVPAPLLEAISDVESKLKTAVHSDPTKKLFSIMGEFKKALAPRPALPEGFDKLPITIQEKVLAALVQDINPIPAKELVRQKVELNKIMKDRNIFDRNDTDSLGFLHNLKDGINKTLEAYGETNPKFLKTMRRADERFARAAKREDLDNVLSGKIVDPKTGEVSYNSLLDILNNRKQQKFLKNRLGDVNYKKLEDFVNVAKAMESVKRNNPNPSGSASMGAAIGLVTSILYGNLSLPATVIGGGSVATTLLTSKRFLNLATRFAKEPTEPLANQLASIVRENTGMTIQALQRTMKGNQEEEK